jgi:hypothetical protein
LAVTVDTVADTAPAVNVTLAVWVSGSVSVTSVARIVLVPAVVDRTLPVVCPVASVTAAGWVIVSAGRSELRLTVLPLTGLPFASRKVTVIVEAATPSATTVVGLAVTVDVPASTAPAVPVAVKLTGVSPVTVAV